MVMYNNRNNENKKLWVEENILRHWQYILSKRNIFRYSY